MFLYAQNKVILKTKIDELKKYGVDTKQFESKLNEYNNNPEIMNNPRVLAEYNKNAQEFINTINRTIDEKNKETVSRTDTTEQKKETQSTNKENETRNIVNPYKQIAKMTYDGVGKTEIIYYINDAYNKYISQFSKEKDIINKSIEFYKNINTEKIKLINEDMQKFNDTKDVRYLNHARKMAEEMDEISLLDYTYKGETKFKEMLDTRTDIIRVSELNNSIYYEYIKINEKNLNIAITEGDQAKISKLQEERKKLQNNIRNNNNSIENCKNHGKVRVEVEAFGKKIYQRTL